MGSTNGFQTILRLCIFPAQYWSTVVIMQAMTSYTLRRSDTFTICHPSGFSGMGDLWLSEKLLMHVVINRPKVGSPSIDRSSIHFKVRDGGSVLILPQKCRIFRKIKLHMAPGVYEFIGPLFTPKFSRNRQFTTPLYKFITIVTIMTTLWPLHPDLLVFCIKRAPQRYGLALLA
jgi:hypothetical protein